MLVPACVCLPSCTCVHAGVHEFARVCVRLLAVTFVCVRVYAFAHLCVYLRVVCVCPWKACMRVHVRRKCVCELYRWCAVSSLLIYNNSFVYTDAHTCIAGEK